MTSTVATVVVSQVEAPPEKTVDREKVCPLLLRIFVANGRHNPIVDYAHGAVPANELQIYTWMDCSLNELTGLIKEVNPDSRRRGTVFDFSIVAPDRMRPPHYAMREIGNTMNGQRGVDDAKTLDQCKFVIGDFVDVAITLPAFEGRGGPPFSRGGRYNYRGLPRHNGELGEGGSGEDRGGFGGGRGDFDGERGSFGGRGGGFGGGRGNFDGERGNFGGRGGGFGGGRGGFGFRRRGGFVRDRSPMERDRF